MNVYDIHLIMDSDVDFATMPEPLQDQLTALSNEWPSFPALETKGYLGKKVVHARLQSDVVTESTLQELFDAFQLNWQVLGIRSAYTSPVVVGKDVDGFDIIEQQYTVTKKIDKAVILPYLADIVDGVDANGNSITRPPTIYDVVYMGMYAGTDPLAI